MISPLYQGLFGDENISAYLSAEAEIHAFIEVERALARAQGTAGVMPAPITLAVDQGLKDLTIAPETLINGTTQSGIPIPGLVAALRAALPEDAAHWVHWGATTQDIMDNALVLRLRPIVDILSKRMNNLIAILARTAEAHATLPMPGRTRTQIATPITYGLRVAQWMHPLLDLRDQLPEIRNRLERVQCGGASGANSAIAPHGLDVMEALANELDLAPSPPWHTNRIGLGDLTHWCAALTGALAAMAGDVILMLRREIGELRLQGGGGSSTMPNKTNPVQAEVLLTLGRHISGLAASASLATQHTEERDGPAWMQEWLVLPQTLTCTGAALRHAVDLIENISPDPDRMAANLALDGGAVHAEAASFALAKHIPRADAQARVKQAAADARTDGIPLLEALEKKVEGIDLQGDLDPARATEASAQIARTLIARARS